MFNIYSCMYFWCTLWPLAKLASFRFKFRLNPWGLQQPCYSQCKCTLKKNGCPKVENQSWKLLKYTKCLFFYKSNISVCSISLHWWIKKQYYPSLSCMLSVLIHNIFSTNFLKILATFYLIFIYRNKEAAPCCYQ